MAERNGDDFRRLLCSAERFKEAAIRFGLCQVKTLGSRSSALLSCVTRADQRRELGVFDFALRCAPPAPCRLSRGMPRQNASRARASEVARDDWSKSYCSPARPLSAAPRRSPSGPAWVALKVPVRWSSSRKTMAPS